MMVVVPALTPREQRHPPVVGRKVAGAERTITGPVRRAVHRPRNMIGDDQTNEDAPDDPGPTAERKQEHAKSELPEQRGSLHKSVKRIGSKIRCEPELLFRRRASRIGQEKPADVSPPKTSIHAVGVAWTIGGCVMAPMGCNPIDRAALQGENAEHGEEILDAFGQLQAAVGEQSVKAERHTKAS